MNLSILLFIIACVLVGIIAWKLFRSVLKTAFSILGIIIVCVLIMGAAIAIDANDFRKNIQEEPIQYFLVHDELVYASFSAKGIMLKEREDIELSTAQKTLSLSNKELRELPHKIFIFQTSAFTWDDISGNLTSHLEQLDLSQANTLFYVKLLETLVDENPEYLYLAFKGENSQILPKTPLVRFTSFAPKKVLTTIQNQGIETKEGIQSQILEQAPFLSKKEKNETLNQTEDI